MSDITDITLSGSCLCGGVRFAVQPPFAAFRYCHCTRCQKASGSAHAANAMVPQAQFSWLAGESQVKHYQLPQAQRFAVSFCTDCGSRVPHLNRDRGTMLIPAGLLDAPPLDMPKPDNVIFWGSRAPWYVVPGELPCHHEYT
jgi:hypothetical protein